MKEWQIDPHSHTDISDGDISFAERHICAKEAGLDGYGGTEHDVPVLKVIREQQNPLFVFLNGVEVTAGVGHIIVYAPTGVRLSPFPIGRPLKETVQRARDSGLKVVMPHLGLGPPPASVPESEIRRLYDAGLFVDGIEVAHPWFRLHHQLVAEKIAKEFKIARLGAGDDHVGNIGRSYLTSFPRLTNNAEVDFWFALHAKTTRPTVSCIPEMNISRRAALFRYAKGLFVGLPEKIRVSPEFAKTMGQYFIANLH